MARPPQYLTAKVEDFGCSIDLAWLRRSGARPGASGRIAWNHRGIEKASVRYTMEQACLRVFYASHTEAIVELLPIVTTATKFGGRRHWFSCPGCARRCRILYGDERFRCRLCLGARYQSQYERQPISVTNRRWRLRQRLENRGGQPRAWGLDDGFPPKPPRMHWTTYRRLLHLDRQLEGRWNGWVHDWLGRIDPVLKASDPFLKELEKETAPPTRYGDNWR